MTKILENFRKAGIFALILGLLWQTSSLSSILNLGHAKADSSLINKIVFTTTEQTIDQNTVSTGIIVQTQRTDGTPEDMTVDTEFVLSSDSTTGQFSTDGSNWYVTPKSVTIGATDGKDSLIFYYRDSTSGVHTLTANVTGETWTDSQNITINDTTNPIKATVNTPANDSYFNDDSMPTQFTGKVADDASGDGLAANSTTYYLKNSDGNYWTGTAWTSTETYLSASNSETTGGTVTNWTSNVAMPTWQDGKYYVKAKATDKASVPNDYEGAEIYFYYDNTAPTGSITINSGIKVTSSQTVNLNFSSDDSNIYQMKVHGDFKNSSNDWQSYTTELANQQLTDGAGSKLIQVQFKDKAGNVSEVYGNKIYFSPTATNIESTTINGTAGYTKDNIHLEYMTTQNRTLTYSEYSSNPAGTTTFTAFGKYFDLSLDSNEGVSNLVLYIYYTQADLDAMGITENQITGLYYWNDTVSGWELYPRQKVVTTNTDGYAGYVRVELDHLTPMTLGADTTAPAIPSTFKAEAKDSKVLLTWNKVSDADHYDIRYRKSTSNNDKVAYSSIYTTKDNETEISGLENDVEYEFDIRAVDSADNKGEWAVVVAKPQLSAQEIARRAELQKQVAYYGATASQSASTSSSSINQENPTDEEIITDGQINTGDETSSETEGARTAVTLGIIIIAIGAALGGYYGYQWWLGDGEVEEETMPKEKKTPKAKKKNKANRRW